MKVLYTCVFFLLCFSLNAQTWQHKIDPELLDKFENGSKIECLILFDKKADVSGAKFLKTKEEKGQFVFNELNRVATTSQKNAIAILEDSKTFFLPYQITNAIYSVLDISQAEKIASLSEVKSLISNNHIKFDEPVEMNHYSRRDSGIVTWGNRMIRSPEIWDIGIRGEGAVVGGQDTGYEWDHPGIQRSYRGIDTLTGNIDHNYNWHDAIHMISPLSGDSIIDPTNNPCGLDATEPCDDHNHGTHTMGTMVGRFQKDKIGVAPEAKWIGCRNMERGNGAPSTYLECFNWFLAPTDLNNENPDPSKSPHVIANSWYCSENEGCLNDNLMIFEEVVNNLKAAGVVVVVSAGNFGSGGCHTVNAQPAIYENSFSVGATSPRDTIAGFSSKGTVMIDGSNRLKPQISAPGVSVHSTIRGGRFASFSGTSMAGPHVAGVVALMISANPKIAGNVDLIEQIIEETAVPKTDTMNCGGMSGMEVPNPIYGYGRIDAFNAVIAAMDSTSSANDLPISNNNILVFPNPAKDQISFSVKDEKIQSIQVFDNLGRLIFSEKLDGTVSHSITTNDWLSGVYHYKIELDRGVYSGKFLVKK